MKRVMNNNKIISCNINVVQFVALYASKNITDFHTLKK